MAVLRDDLDEGLDDNRHPVIWMSSIIQFMTRASRAEKQATHERIVAEAARPIRECGTDPPGVAELMAAAGLTHGGFHQHFSTRDEMLAQATEPARSARPAVAAADGPHRRRLLDALARSIAEDGYRATTVADIVRRARTSRRTFYEHFADKEACFIALLAEANADVIRRIDDAVDRAASPETQVQQAITAWIESAGSQPVLMLSWIRDSPTLGAKTRRLQRDLQEGFVVLLQELTDTAEPRAAGIAPMSRRMAIVLLGGLRELIAVTVEDGGPISDIRGAAVQASLALGSVVALGRPSRLGGR